MAEDRIALTLAGFVSALTPTDIPEEVSRRARHLLLDAIGCALATRREAFVPGFADAVAELSAGDTGARGVIGFSRRLPLREAMLFNGALAHGLDYDDTHMAGVVHLTVSVLPTVLGLAAQKNLDGASLLAAYVAATEAGARIAMAARGGFHANGLHPTGIVGAFACALAAGKLMGLDAAQLVHAQGIALSTASGSLQFIEDGAWTKRLHPGWAAQAGVAAAVFARHGTVAPQAPYAGRYGLYASFTRPAGDRLPDLSLATATIDADGRATEWEIPRIAVKPYAMCHFVHAATDAAVALHRRGLAASSITGIEVLVPDAAVQLVCEPSERKRRPQNDYDAKFSLAYAVASGLLRGRLGLQELLPSAYLDPAAQALMDKVSYRVDPDSTFPKHYSGEVVVTMADGRVERHREAVNRGHPDRPVTDAEVREKFMENATLHFSKVHAEAVCKAVLGLDRLASARELESLLAQDP